MPTEDYSPDRSKDMGLDPGDGLHNVGGRVVEVRKEKSRDAARSRRGKENYEFYELAKLLPLPAAITSQLDKASIIRLSISYLKLRDFCGHGDPPWPREGPPISKVLKGAQRRRTSPGMAVELFELHQGAHILQSLDGFAFALSNDGRFLYISETVSIYLGLSQVEMAGSSIFDYVHTQDHQELADELGISLSGLSSAQSSPVTSPGDSPSANRDVTPPLSDRLPTMSPSLERGQDRCFCLRMKSTLTKRGVHNRSSGYRVVLILGQFRHQLNFGMPSRKSQAPLIGLSGTAIALPPPTITELRIEADTFIMRLTAKFKVIYCENMISNLTNWKSEDMTGKDVYQFCHPGDIQLLRKTHEDLLLKGQVLSPSMRLLNKHGGYIWVQLCATSLYTTKTSDDQTVLAIFQTISSIEHRDVVMDSSQLVTAHDSGGGSSTGPTVSGCLTEDTTIDREFRQDSPVKSISPDKADTVSDNEPLLHSPGHIDTTSVFPDSVDNDFLLDENPDDALKSDTKTSRRKTDRPRKRRRESGDDAKNHTTKLVTSERSEKTIVQVNLPVIHGSLPDSPCDVRVVERTSPQLPEDLSYRPTLERPNFTANCDVKESRCRGDGDVATSSVKELEKIMNRHLSSRAGLGAAHTDDHDFIHRNFSETPKSSIQWVGSPPISRDSLSASAFLRHLYTSRESVIRSNCRPTCYNGEVNSLSMLSLPNADNGKDQLHLNIPHISLQSKPHYSSQKDPVSMLACPDDDFSMTPPSSVSPQDKVTSPFQESDVTGECLNPRFTHGGNISMAHGKNTFDGINDNTSDVNVNRTNFLHLPNYQYPGPDSIQFSQNPSSQNGVIYESRTPQSHGMWFGSAYTS